MSLYSIRLFTRFLLLVLVTAWIPSAPLQGPLGDPPLPPTTTPWPIDASSILPAPPTPQPLAGGALSDPPAPAAPVTLPPVVDPQLPSLSIDVSVTTDTVAVGETTTLTVTVRNAATDPAQNLLVTLPTPDGALAVSGGDLLGSLKGWSWKVAQLAANSSVSFTGSVRLLRRPAGDALLPGQPCRRIIMIQSDRSATRSRSAETAAQRMCATRMLFYDGLGRQIQTKQEGAGAWQNIVVDTRYDGLGRTIEQSQARYSTENATSFFDYTTPSATLFNHTTTSYDALSRPLDVTAPDGTVNKTRYWLGAQGLATAVYDANNHLTAYESDALGRRSWIYEYHGTGTVADPYVADTTTTSVYNSLDLLTGVLDAQGNSSTINYDSMGRKTAMSDPDMGVWYYAYNANGNLTNQTDAKNQTSSFTYDKLNRLTGKTMPGILVSSYHYDEAGVPNGKGQRTSMGTSLNGVTQTSARWEYDTRGHTTLAAQNVIGGTDMGIRYYYDSGDRLTTLRFDQPNENVNYTYDTAWHQYSMCGTTCYINSATYSALGQPKTRALNNSLTTSWVYNSPMQRLEDLEIGTVATPTSVTRRGYTYDPAGNITTILDYLYTQTQNFTYDTRDRLTHAWTTGGAGAPGMAYNISTTYNVLGNITSKTGLGNYVYGPTNSGPHQVRTIGPVATAINLSYDANGNMDIGGAWDYNWNADNTLASMSNATSGASESYKYDADGERVVRTAGGVTTIYFQGIWEQTTTGARKLTYTFNGDTVALRSSAGLFFLQGDHLGSITWALNTSGTPAYGQEYGPWGQVRAGTMGTSLNYTGSAWTALGCCIIMRAITTRCWRGSSARTAWCRGRVRSRA